MTEGHLSVSRVNRLLRPLRNKCNGLAALAKSSAATSRSTSSNGQWVSPFIVLQPPAGAKRLTAAKYSMDDLELSRRIYAVCDAFKNIVHVAFGRPSTRRVPSLATMCTLVLGENLHLAASDSISGDDSTDEDDELDADRVYELVPPHHRRFLIVSHALSMILCICSHHHTLLTALLDHCLSFGLVYESTRLLNIILAQAFLSSNSSFAPPVIHPAHTNYLLDLHAKWTAEGNLSETTSSSLLFSTQTFSNAVLDAMSRSSTDPHILWTSKVLDNLLHAIRYRDIDSYSLIVRTLSRAFWDTSASLPDGTRDDAQLRILGSKLSELMSNLFDLLFSRHDFSLMLPGVYMVIDMLSDCHATRLQFSRTSTLGSHSDLRDMVITFTAHIFIAFRKLIDDADRFLDILEASEPVPTTFSKLMVYFSRDQERQTFDDFMKAFLMELNKYSSMFLSESFFHLDASLWASALHHFQTSIAGSQKSSPALVSKYKRQLIEAVETAERRCFGRTAVNAPISSLPIHASSAARTRRDRISGHWEWEDMVGAWIRRTPVHKKRKIDDSLPRTPSRHSPHDATTSTLASVATSPLSLCQHSAMYSPSSSNFQLSEVQTPTDNGSEYQDDTDKENCPRRSPITNRRSRLVQRRRSNFSSLLADAQTSRIILHSKPRSQPKPSSSIISEKCILPHSSQEYRHVIRNQIQKLPPALSGPLLSSDDSLDLFAYATSSPARC